MTYCEWMLNHNFDIGMLAMLPSDEQEELAAREYGLWLDAEEMIIPNSVDLMHARKDFAAGYDLGRMVTLYETTQAE